MVSLEGRLAAVEEPRVKELMAACRELVSLFERDNSSRGAGR
ncbi:hypothetical protein [Meiothermus taiwanensis]|nr:hypothetical protein [Meiothermus taiwanensis]